MSQQLICDICGKHYLGMPTRVQMGRAGGDGEDDYEVQCICAKCEENARDLMELS
jgi:hypothetical protein